MKKSLLIAMILSLFAASLAYGEGEEDGLAGQAQNSQTLGDSLGLTGVTTTQGVTTGDVTCVGYCNGANTTTPTTTTGQTGSFEITQGQDPTGNTVSVTIFTTTPGLPGPSSSANIITTDPNGNPVSGATYSSNGTQTGAALPNGSGGLTWYNQCGQEVDCPVGDNDACQAATHNSCSGTDPSSGQSYTCNDSGCTPS